jgi:hypothetical protein
MEQPQSISQEILSPKLDEQSSKRVKFVLTNKKAVLANRKLV